MTQQYLNKGHLFLHPDLLVSNPTYASIVAEIIAVFSRTELHLAFFASSMFGGNDTKAFRTYFSMGSARSRRNFLDVAAKNCLNSTLYENYKETSQRISACRKTRNRLAHGIWARASDIHDGLVVIDVDEVTGWSGHLDEVEIHHLMNCYVYSFSDLSKALEHNQSLNRDLLIQDLSCAESS